MKQIILGLGVLLSAKTFATPNNYDLKMELFRNGKKVSSPRIIVKEGEKGSITSRNETEKSFIDVVATRAKDNSIMMKFKVGYMGKNGERKILGEPIIIAREGEPSKIEISQNQNSPAELALTVTAKKASKMSM